MSHLIGNVAAAVNLLKSGKLGDNPTIVTILCDSGKWRRRTIMNNHKNGIAICNWSLLSLS